MKRVKIILSESEVKQMMNFFGNEFLSIGDDNAWNTPHGKAMTSIHDKIIRAKNKQQNIYYLWQLKDRDGEVVHANILKEWGGGADP